MILKQGPKSQIQVHFYLPWAAGAFVTSIRVLAPMSIGAIVGSSLTFIKVVAYYAVDIENVSRATTAAEAARQIDAICCASAISDQTFVDVHASVFHHIVTVMTWKMMLRSFIPHIGSRHYFFPSIMWSPHVLTRRCTCIDSFLPDFCSRARSYNCQIPVNIRRHRHNFLHSR